MQTLNHFLFCFNAKCKIFIITVLTWFSLRCSYHPVSKYCCLLGVSSTICSFQSPPFLVLAFLEFGEILCAQAGSGDLVRLLFLFMQWALGERQSSVEWGSSWVLGTGPWWLVFTRTPLLSWVLHLGSSAQLLPPKDSVIVPMISGHTYTASFPPGTPPKALLAPRNLCLLSVELSDSFIALSLVVHLSFCFFFK